MRELLEREDDLAELDRVLARARAGTGHAIAVEGPGGIGKTSLLTAARAQGRDAGMLILHARGSELERTFPFGVVRQLFERAAAEERHFAGAASLAKPIFDLADNADESSYARLHGLYWLCANLAAEQPLVVCVDDAQWADEPSLSFLGFLLRRLEDLPVALLVGTRPRAEQESDVLRAIVTDPATRVLRPTALSGDAVREWVRKAVDDHAADGFCRACHETTGGNPFLVSELLHEVTHKRLRATDAEAAAVRALGPEAISTVVLQRLQRLPSDAPALARAIAILGEGARPPLAAQLAGLDPVAAETALDALCRADVITRDEDDRLGFVHPIVLAAIYHDLPAGVRRDGHHRAARLLAERGAAPEEIASHLALTAPRGDAWAVQALRAAAQRALILGDPAAALACLQRALEEPPPAETQAAVLHELARAEAQSGRPDAVEHFRAAMELAADAHERGQIAVGLARALKFRGDSPAAVDVLRQALAELDHGPLAEELELELVSSGYISLSARPLLAAEIAALEAPERAATQLDRLHLMASAFETVIAAGPCERSAELARKALGPEQPTDVSAGGHVFISAAGALMFSEGYEEAERAYDQAVSDARRRGSSVGFAAASSLRSLLYYRCGRLSEAEADATAALDLRNDVHGSQGYLACALNALVFTRLERGEADHELLALADDFFATQPTEDLPYSQAIHARGWLRAQLGDSEGGLEELLACGAREQLWGVGTPQIIAWRSSAAEVCLALGRLEQGRALADAELQLARRIGAPRAIGVALRAAALAESGERRIELLTDAVTSLEASQGTLELARARVDLGRALVRAGRRDAARDHLRGGQELALRCGASRLVEQAHRELLATGARPRRSAAASRDDLTPSERRVTEMAADGLTNREIAQALFVTEKTVETHLGRAFSKLGVRSRKQLADALAAVA
ncbi:AAA family ATPase [Solirubrobacter sp. CPCC 204708]|uniref:AAA family ATPase n=1 Tax=Solirubrobacter deserti TaxID=2282478 RepID=A0ABT4RKW2_9ACTN|nr:LuxR family transcriptional regulator [Solirubrobacter deserti]MBE2317349.1 AAA family ATPase [Solirubrobacter deserti]MDA0139078.1 AAA family ATPase [Solirubrobacter deserti]